MEIDITTFVLNADPFQYSGNKLEHGQDAGRITWNNAKAHARDHAPLLTTDEQLQAFRDHARGMGFSEADDMAHWTEIELNALFVQLISGDMREAGMDACDIDEFDWNEYESNEQIARNIFKGIDGRIYYYLGS